MHIPMLFAIANIRPIQQGMRKEEIAKKPPVLKEIWREKGEVWYERYGAMLLFNC